MGGIAEITDMGKWASREIPAARITRSGGWENPVPERNHWPFQLFIWVKVFSFPLPKPKETQTMRRVLPLLLTAVAVGMLSQIATAQPPQRGPGRPDPEQLFKRLDANHDGNVTVDEIPEGAPDRLKGLLKRADADRDRKITSGEFAAAAKKMRESMHRDRGGPPDARKTGPPQHGRSQGHASRPAGHPPIHGRPPGHPSAQRRPGPPPGAGRGTPNPRVAFRLMDGNRDGSLSMEEFTAGVAHFHRAHPSARPPQGHRPSPHAKRPSPSHGHGPAHAKKPCPPRGHGSPDAKRPGPSHHGELGKHFAEARKKLMEKVDKNKDGKIDDDEKKAAHAAFAKHIADRKKEFMAKYDKNEDGKIDDAEKKAVRAAFAKHIHERKKPEPKKKPSEKPEVKKAEPKESSPQADRAKRREEMRKKFMAKYDKNEDGELDDAEKKAIRDEWIKRQRERD